MKYWSLFLFVEIGLLISCSKSEITLPPQSGDVNLVGTTFIDGSVMKKMEGIYVLNSGSDNLGSDFVCKVSKFKVSFFSNKDGIFIILKYGLKIDGSIQFSGFWRHSETTTQGNIRFSISATYGASDLLNGILKNLILNGDVLVGNSKPEAISLKYSKPFSQAAIYKPFMIFGHHGVQTTANPPYAENSLLGVKNDEDYGVTGLEFDVRLTKDNVPICIHDASINVRLTKKGPLSGNWNQYNFSFLQDHVLLIDGQEMASLDHLLTAFVDSTTLKYFWMDIKGDPDIFKHLEPVVRRAYANAQSKKRNVVIFAGMPSDDVILDFKNNPSYGLQSNPLPTLCEQTMDLCIENKSMFFGPRYSEGLLLSDVERGHSQNPGISTISWTLNSKNIIKDYLKDGKFDGFITDYPAYVVYDFYTKF